jgi:hypothetical protein
MAEFGVPQSEGQWTPTMQTELNRQIADPAGRLPRHASDESRERELLAEFMRHETVVSLASDIAERLGAETRGKDLIEAADLGGNRRSFRRTGGPTGAMAD